MRKREIFWFIGTVIIILIVSMLLFGFVQDTTLDLNFHDTYFVLESRNMVWLLGILIFFGVYLVRVLRRKFKNLTANLFLMISTLWLLIFLNSINSILDTFIHQNYSWTVYPPLSMVGSQEGFESEIAANENYIYILSNLILALQILLMIFLVYCGFKSGRNYKQKE